jgi:hypothetical protein
MDWLAVFIGIMEEMGRELESRRAIFNVLLANPYWFSEINL